MSYNVLIIGSGGREHALAWGISRSKELNTLYIAPGNPGTEPLGINVPISPSGYPSVKEYFEAVHAFAIEKKIDVTVIGPEQPLVDGITDFLEEKGLKVFGPSQKAAQLEGSKIFSKWLMHKYNIPTADSESFTGETVLEDVEAWLKVENEKWPVVIKADGLAAGKGVFICKNLSEASAHIQRIKDDPSLRKAATRVVVEEFMEGEEASVFAITDGRHAKLLLSAQDHKRIGEGDTGLNTGGMGAYGPAPVADSRIMKLVEDTILYPTLGAMQVEGHPYRGVLYLGLMINEEGPRVVEYNCRFGDPECQVIVPAMKSDLLRVIMATVNFELEKEEVEMHDGHYCCVVMASGGYPEAFEKGMEIHGLEEVSEDSMVFHSGTRSENGKVYTNGGRVLTVTSKGASLSEAIDAAYRDIEKISFDKAYYRRDIGAKGLKRSS
ncbi:phosphoribosylamine--glycine ligase [Balneolaceae bacterium ANBcel3]|nr:phosphoribosylamine--glycine ligase [Balneolaceae bacterium ANBcel3]